MYITQTHPETAPLWDETYTRLLPQSTQQENIIAVVRRYFTQSTADVCTKSLAMVEAALQEAQGTAVYDMLCLLVIQEANDQLHTESKAMAHICAAQGSPFVCQIGCCGCCHQLVLCSPWESSLIVAYLQAQEQKKSFFLQQWPAWHKQAQTLSASYIAWGQKFYGEGKDDGSHQRDDYAIPCPFLDHTGCCTIYTVRPHACRSSVAVDGRCMDVKGEHLGGQYTMLFSLYTGHHKARQGLFQILQTTKNAVSTVPMPTMVWHKLNATL